MNLLFKGYGLRQRPLAERIARPFCFVFYPHFLDCDRRLPQRLRDLSVLASAFSAQKHPYLGR